MNVLVIRLSALGDIIQSFTPFAAIRAHHPEARITLLTTAPFAAMLRAAPWFDAVEVDARPRWWDMAGLWRLRAMLRPPATPSLRRKPGSSLAAYLLPGWAPAFAGATGKFDFVYDLQTSARSSRYFALAGRPPWSGIARGCAHPHANPRRDFMHTRERQREQLEMAGIAHFPTPDLTWLAAQGSHHDIPANAVLLVPGAAPTRPRKRWPAAHYAALASQLAAQGRVPVLIGARAETDIAATIRAACPATIDLIGQTSLADIAALALRAKYAIGNDTGPMHLITAMGCPATVLFSADSDPDLTAPRGPNGAWPTVLRAPDLADLPVSRVAANLP